MDSGLFGTRNENVSSVANITPAMGSGGAISNIGVRDDDFFPPNSFSSNSLPDLPPNPPELKRTKPLQSALKRKPSTGPPKQTQFKKPISTIKPIPNRKDQQQMFDKNDEFDFEDRRQKRKHRSDDGDDFEGRMHQRKSSSSRNDAVDHQNATLKMGDFSVFAGAEDGKDPVVAAAAKMKPDKRRSHDNEMHSSDDDSDTESDEESSSDEDDDPNGLPPTKRPKPGLDQKAQTQAAVNQAFMPFHQSSFSMSNESRQKAIIKARIRRRDRGSGKFTKIPEDATVQQLLDIDAEADYEQESELAVDGYRNTMSFVVKQIEDKSGHEDLEGWSEDFQLTSRKLDPILHKIHDRYPMPMNPFLQLTVALGTHATEFMNMKKKMRTMAHQAHKQQPRLFQAAVEQQRQQQQPSDDDLYAVNLDPPRSVDQRSTFDRFTDHRSTFDRDDDKDSRPAFSIPAKPIVPAFVVPAATAPRIETSPESRTKTVELGPTKKTSTTKKPSSATLVVNKAPKSS
jgi:hypothetical protein